MQITELLQRVRAGDQQALHTVIPLVYEELQKLAAGHLRKEGKPRSLDTTALVHEAFLRLAQGQQHLPDFNLTGLVQFDCAVVGGTLAQVAAASRR